MAHMHYKGTGKMHSFRGLLADGGQDKIRIQGPVGAIAWRITKFQGFPNLPATVDQESLLLVWREKQTSVPISAPTVDFTDSELLAAAYYVGMSSTYGYSSDVVIFDNALFSRNIYVTHTEGVSSFKQNYYIELEEVKVSKAGMAQLAVAAARRLEEK
jgi:hypothetical protein